MLRQSLKNGSNELQLKGLTKKRRSLSSQITKDDFVISSSRYNTKRLKDSIVQNSQNKVKEARLSMDTTQRPRTKQSPKRNGLNKIPDQQINLTNNYTISQPEEKGFDLQSFDQRSNLRTVQSKRPKNMNNIRISLKTDNSLDSSNSDFSNPQKGQIIVQSFDQICQ